MTNDLKQSNKTKKYHDDLLHLVDSLEQKFELRILFLIAFLTITLFTISLTLTSMQQKEMIDLFLNDQNETIANFISICSSLQFSSINYLVHPFSLFLILIYMVLFWRRSFCLKCLFARPAAPMIVHPFKKRNRFLTAAVYGAISFEVVEIVYTAISSSSASDIFSQFVYDPSGLFKLSIRIIEVLLAALKYYPPLIAFCADSILIYASTALYMIVDLGNYIFTEGRCTGFTDSNKEFFDLTRYSQVLFIIVKDTPQFFILSLLTSTLIVRSISKTIQMLKNSNRRILINEDIIFYSIQDLKYSLNLYNRAVESGLKKSIFRRFIYNWESNFKFSSRIINTYVVALLALFYFFVDIVFYGIYSMRTILSSLNDMVIDIEDIALKTLLKQILSYDNFTILFFIAAIGSYLICLIQLIFSLRSLQQNLLNLYKGKKQNIPFLKSNSSVSNGNTHYAGFLVGFLLNGFLFIFVFIFIVVLVVYLLTQLLSLDDLKSIVLTILPFIVVFIFKYLFNILCSRFIFLQNRAKFLALNNFRAYSIFVYITFFFDCFIGALNALIRLIIGFLGSLFFMPRIGYSFLGRQIENFDMGYTISTSYYQMEYTHSHPVMLSFCALLYYKRLMKKLDKYYSKDIIYAIRLRKMTNVADINLENATEPNPTAIQFDEPKPFYKKRILNKWFLLITLINNNSLIFNRKKEYSNRKLVYKDDNFINGDVETQITKL